MKGSDHIRELVAQEAARLMYEEGVKEYRDAKHKAARRFGAQKAASLGSHLPSNAEIHAELRRLLELHEEKVLPERVWRLRLLALSYLELFEPFHPYLVGSVLSGVVREKSDIDLHLFADSAEEVDDFLRQRGIPFDFEVTTVRKGNAFLDYPHFYLDDDGVIVECTVYPAGQRHQAPKSSITGKAMARADAKKLRKIIAQMIEEEA
ncbi:MAG: hypothetical protein GWO11_04115 [Desulfuromonadales bacterium]|nr:hypothetical protein [Desulfuromonadales bacterium]NIR33614.1 hypothetical protein [Desulfuromonadales bacterium]NIS43991.1 hypothetical protein [Desulfuromonadales bacterium]